MDREAWMKGVVTRWEDALVSYARRFVGFDRARDVVQETFLGVWRNREAAGVGDVEGLRSYVYRACRNRCIDVLRMRDLSHANERSDADVDAIAASGHAPTATPTAEARLAARQDLVALVRLLPKRQQEILELRLVDGLSYKEIAAIMGLTRSNVGMLLHQALMTLRAAGHTADDDGGSR